jgi:hypothetical protein
MFIDPTGNPTGVTSQHSKFTKQLGSCNQHKWRDLRGLIRQGRIIMYFPEVWSGGRFIPGKKVSGIFWNGSRVAGKIRECRAWVCAYG